MPSSPPPNRSSPNRHVLTERCYTVRTCEQCRRRRRACDGQRPCTHCAVGDLNCVYSVVSDLPRTVFLTSTARRLSSGSACETCRRRKTKCDGATPCAYCASAGIPCVNNSERRKRFMGIPSPPKPSTSADAPDADAIDRIEDRLQRIEKLMTAFAPTANSPLSSQSQPPHSAKQTGHHQVDPSFRKPLSSPPPRKHRHSVQGISVAKEQAELRTAYALKKKQAGITPFLSIHMVILYFIQHAYMAAVPMCYLHVMLPMDFVRLSISHRFVTSAVAFPIRDKQCRGHRLLYHSSQQRRIHLFEC